MAGTKGALASLTRLCSLEVHAAVESVRSLVQVADLSIKDVTEHHPRRLGRCECHELRSRESDLLASWVFEVGKQYGESLSSVVRVCFVPPF